MLILKPRNQINREKILTICIVIIKCVKNSKFLKFVVLDNAQLSWYTQENYFSDTTHKGILDYSLRQLPLFTTTSCT